MTTEMKLYQSEDLQVRLDVLVENETVWLNQAQIGALFGVQKSAISKHLKHIFDSGELRQEAVVSILETVELACNSPDSKIFLICFEIAGTAVP